MLSAYLLATINACLNTTAALFMLAGVRAIKQKRIETHRRFMLAAFSASCLFLVSYLTRIVLHGDTKFTGEGALRVVYLCILASHVLLAMAVAPMVLVTLSRGLKRVDDKHRKLARWTFPTWLYVSVTGVMVYLMLYQR